MRWGYGSRLRMCRRTRGVSRPSSARRLGPVVPSAAGTVGSAPASSAFHQSAGSTSAESVAAAIRRRRRRPGRRPWSARRTGIPTAAGRHRPSTTRTPAAVSSTPASTASTGPIGCSWAAPTGSAGRVRSVTRLAGGLPNCSAGQDRDGHPAQSDHHAHQPAGEPPGGQRGAEAGQADQRQRHQLGHAAGPGGGHRQRPGQRIGVVGRPPGQPGRDGGQPGAGQREDGQHGELPARAALAAGPARTGQPPTGRSVAAAPTAAMTAAALPWHSASSVAGTESATMPAPAWM